MKKTPLYEKIYRDYESKIKSGKLKPGNKLPTEMELSAQYKVSRITVTRALKELELSNLIYRIKGSGSYVSELESTGTMATSSSNPLSFISLVLPFDGKFSSEILQGVEDIAKEKGYFVSFHNSQGDAEIERAIVNDIVSRNSSGIVMYPSSSFNNLDMYTNMIIDNYPFVLIDHAIPGADTSLVWADNQKGFYDITNHLIDLGHKRIIFIGTSMFELSSETERYKGFCKAHVDKGLSLLQNHLYLYNSHTIQSKEDFLDHARKSADELFMNLEHIPEDQRPTAIACVNDDVASIIISTALEHGHRIPDDFSVTGFDNESFAEHLTVPLTTIAQPIRQIGRTAATELIDVIGKPDRAKKTQTIEAQLVIRSSTSTPK